MDRGLVDKSSPSSLHLAINPRTGLGVLGDVEAMHWLEIVEGLRREPHFKTIASLQATSHTIPDEADGPELRPSSRVSGKWPAGDLTWIPRKALDGADLIFHPFAVPALVSPVPQAVLTAAPVAARPKGLAGRLAWAAAQASVANAELRFVYDDLGVAEFRVAERLAPWVSPRFTPDAPAMGSQPIAELTGERPYLLCHGLNPEGADMLAAAWSWAAGSVGDAYALLILGATPRVQSRLWEWAGEHGWQANLYFPSCADLDALRDVYRQALIYVQIDPILSGQGLRWAQAGGAAIVGFERGPTASITGAAGILVPEGDARQLGAAILTLLVEEVAAPGSGG